MKRSKGILWSALVVMLLLAGCGSSGSPACALSGTITDVSTELIAGETITVGIEIGDPIISAEGPFELQTTLTWPGGLTAGYLLDIGSLTPGNYYVVAVRDFNYWGSSGQVAIDCGSTVDVPIGIPR